MTYKFSASIVIDITVHAAPLTSKLCVEVSRTGYEFFLDGRSENWKLEM